MWREKSKNFDKIRHVRVHVWSSRGKAADPRRLFPDTHASRDKSRFLISMKSRDTRTHLFFFFFFLYVQTVSKRHTHANNYLVILRGSLNTLRKVAQDDDCASTLSCRFLGLLTNTVYLDT